VWIKPRDTRRIRISKLPPPPRPSSKKSSLAQTIYLSMRIMRAPVGFFLRQCVAASLLFLPAFQPVLVFFLRRHKSVYSWGGGDGKKIKKGPNVFRKPTMPRTYPMCPRANGIAALERAGRSAVGPRRERTGEQTAPMASNGRSQTSVTETHGAVIVEYIVFD